ncbi:MAG: hypothetical protein J6C86_08925, partial [Bacteroidaceae bacterium]|nr:hypothetical protein [Bacteroidaceae bacterium]
TTVRYKFARLVDWRNLQCRFFENALGSGKKTVCFGVNVKKCIISVLKKCLNRNLKVDGFWAVFEGENGGFACKILVINMLLIYSEISKKCVRRDFLSVFENFVFN